MSKMADDTTQIGQQLLALLNTLQSLPAKQKEQMASSQYCEDADRLLELAKEAIPEVDPRLWPTPLEPKDQHSFRYVEIETFVLRILVWFQDTTIDFQNCN
jgi:hypothetical protein